MRLRIKRERNNSIEESWDVRIYNIYNLSPASYTLEGDQSTLLTLTIMLKREGEHIVLEDFNLYYPD